MKPVTPTPTPEPESHWKTEIEALNQCLALLTALDKHAQTRALKYLTARLGVYISDTY